MPPKQTGARRGRPPGRPSGVSKKAAGKAAGRPRQTEPESSSAEEPVEIGEDESLDAAMDEVDEEEEKKSIPPELLTRILHEFFENDSSKISRDANAAVAKYMDVFVREAIARAAAERDAGFLEVEDLEKVAPQLLLDM